MRTLVVVTLLLCCLWTGCAKQVDPIQVLENPHFRVSEGPRVLAENLNHPAAPRQIGGDLIFAESGKGTINRLRDRKVIPLIEGFGVDNYLGYKISVLGVEILSMEQIWLVASAEAKGKLFIFDARDLPNIPQPEQEIKIDDSMPLNPFDFILVGDGSTLVASGGTENAYQAPFSAVNQAPMRPVFGVETGLAGLAADPKSGKVYGAVTGSGQGDGEVIRWEPMADVIQPESVAKGFHNLVDVLVTKDGLLLALEFGPFEAEHAGRVLTINEKGKVLPLITGLDAPSGFHLDEGGTLLITTFGKPGKSDGTLLSFELSRPIKAQ